VKGPGAPQRQRSYSPHNSKASMPTANAMSEGRVCNVQSDCADRLGYRIPAVDPEQEKQHQEHAEPKVFHVVIGCDASGRLPDVDPSPTPATVNESNISWR